MFVDLVFLGDFCNLDCVYCSAGPTRWRKVNETLEALRPGGDPLRVDLAWLRHVLLELIDGFADQGVVGVKLSGGEIFVEPELAVSVIGRACRRLEVVQVLTNATRIEELLALVDAHANLHVQVSLDGPTPESNAARSRLESETQLVLGNVRTLAARTPLEVNVVLTRWNTRCLPRTLDYWKGLGGDVIVYPFPVRPGPAGPPAGNGFPVPRAAAGPFLPLVKVWRDVAPRPEDLAGLDAVLDDFDRFAAVLPPRSYVQALRRFFDLGNRRGDCAVPRAITGVNQEGVQAVCSCGDLGVFGPVRPRLRPPPPGPVWGRPCRRCFTHYEIVHHVASARGVRQGFTRRLVEAFLAAEAARPGVRS